MWKNIINPTCKKIIIDPKPYSKLKTTKIIYQWSLLQVSILKIYQAILQYRNYKLWSLFGPMIKKWFLFLKIKKCF